MTIAPEAKLGSYETLELLGKDEMGEVWRARNTQRDRIRIRR